MPTTADIAQSTTEPLRERLRRTTVPSSVTTTSSTAEDTGSGTEESCTTLLRGDPQLAAVLGTLPSSSRELLRRIEQQKDEITVLKEENTRLRAREVEVSALTLRLQQQFSATQLQVDRLKSQIRMELINPVTEDEYRAIEALEESKRDLLDTVKCGIFQQLGSMRASRDTAVRRASELATEVARLTDENKELQQRIKETETVLDVERQSFRRQLQEAEQRGSLVTELEGKLRDVETRLKNAYIDQEQFLTAKLNASVKTEDATRLTLRVREAEMDVERYKTAAECSEQKLDILKGEYYELKLKNTQRIMELEACLRAAEEKLKTLSDLELESELFISNLAQQADGQLTFSSMSAPSAGGGVVGDKAAPTSTNALSSYESWLALPRSRKLAHTLTVTKRCLNLENRLTALQHDIEFKDKQLARLQTSLEMAREALNNTNSPFAMVERTVEKLTADNEELHNKVMNLSEENALLRQRLEQRTTDVQVLCNHRKELLRIQRILRRLGLENQVADSASLPCGTNRKVQRPHDQGEVDATGELGGSGYRLTTAHFESPTDPSKQYSRYPTDDSLRTTAETKMSATECNMQQTIGTEGNSFNAVVTPGVIQFSS
ncbi:hypothetical protein, conserved [Trypanosoma brucei brucei TREU927]|uniref:Uncharacterized protein n=1 Tax=Trypanosoma brucei brucei (strain 927/4 GUTat10.1) TaxID=185431 RepID=Q582I4_TRYB2|nr:hypothetical protein, conserved [Trypanosoma brucei brucei TREU927]AAX78847.1 hypothetical protein, conserved [Trypanosoma brucei]AAZ12633.1 hypothetical protein, conserved [Trypanosoma brucei brucei TREU927]